MSTARDTEAVVFLTVRIPPELREELAEIAERNDRTVAAEIRRALKIHVRESK